MRANPNFMSNFSDGNMTDSVKIADYGGSDHDATLHKQFLAYAGGGRAQFEGNQQRDKVDGKFELPNTKPIKTQQSQVDGFDGGFKKLKSGNQAQILNELRNQFDYIRNMQPAEHKQEEKMSSSSQQSRHSNHRLQNNSSSSISSSKVKQKEVTNNNREQRLWQVERKQFQIMVHNCQIKIQELLHAEMEYKKMIHQLRTSNALIKTPIQTKSDTQIRQLQKQLKQQRQKNFQLTTEVEKSKANLKQINEKTSKLQSQYNYRSKDENKLNDQKRKLEEYLRLEKDRYMNCQIQKRKYQMENQLLIKQRQQEISRMQRQMEHQTVLHELNVKNLIKKYDDQIQIKDRRYMLLLSQFQKLKKDYAQTKEERDKPNNHNMHFMDIFKRLLDERKNSQTEQLNRTLTNLILKFQEGKERYSDSSSQQSSSQQQNQQTQKLLAQIRILKAEIQALKNGSGQGIDLQPMKKMYEAEVAALKDTIVILQRKIKNLIKDPTPQQPNINNKPNPFAEVQIAELKKRISQLQASSKRDFPNLEQNEQIIKSLKQKIQNIDQQLRGQRRKRNEAQFQLSKMQKQLQFRTNLIANQKQSVVRVKQGELDRANQNISHWKQQIDNMRKFYEQKIFEKNKLLEQSINTVEVTTIQKNYSQSLDKARLDYERQINQLAERLANYNSSSLQYDSLLKKYTTLEAAYFDLQKAVFKVKQSNQTVDHLWYIKQAEYGNVDQILRQLKGGKAFLRPGASALPANNSGGLGVMNFKETMQSAILNNFNATQGYSQGQSANQGQGGYSALPPQPPTNYNSLTSSQQGAIQNQIHSSLAQIFNRSTGQPKYTQNASNMNADQRLNPPNSSNTVYNGSVPVNNNANFILDQTSNRTSYNEPSANRNSTYNDPNANRASNFYNDPNASRGSNYYDGNMNRGGTSYQQPALRSSQPQFGNDTNNRASGFYGNTGYNDPYSRTSNNYSTAYG